MSGEAAGRIAPRSKILMRTGGAIRVVQRILVIYFPSVMKVGIFYSLHDIFFCSIFLMAGTSIVAIFNLHLWSYPWSYITSVRVRRSKLYVYVPVAKRQPCGEKTF
jgi:hypothetical protein